MKKEKFPLFELLIAIWLLMSILNLVMSLTEPSGYLAGAYIQLIIALIMVLFLAFYKWKD